MQHNIIDIINKLDVRKMYKSIESKQSIKRSARSNTYYFIKFIWVVYQAARRISLFLQFSTRILGYQKSDKSIFIVRGLFLALVYIMYSHVLPLILLILLIFLCCCKFFSMEFLAELHPKYPGIEGGRFIGLLVINIVMLEYVSFL